jgi:hypothetical protein
MQTYSIGNRFIVPWSGASKCTSPSCSIIEDEEDLNEKGVLCLWISSKDWDTGHVALHQAHINDFFTAGDKLLIGASSRLGVNLKCAPGLNDLVRIKCMLDNQHTIRPSDVMAPRRYVDSQETQLQASIFTLVTVGGTITYKRQTGLTMKDVLVERWRNKKDRNPGDLEAFGGIQVSLCTGNAIRTRILDILRSRTIENYLNSVSFEWISLECETAYFTALTIRRLFRQFWAEYPEWRASAGDAISLCLDKLQHTGVDPDNRQLDALWVEAFDVNLGEESFDLNLDDDSTNSFSGRTEEPAEELIVSLFRSEYTWTGLVKESMESYAMAVMVTACLDYHNDNCDGRRCQGYAFRAKSRAGYPVFETSLILNSSLLKDRGLDYEQDNKRWNIDKVQKSARFDLGDHGTLRVLKKLKCCGRLEMEWTLLFSKIIQEGKNVVGVELILGRGVEKHHRKYISGTCLHAPMRILVVSSRKEPMFSEGI